MARKLLRRNKGDKFTEGSRLLWEAMARTGLGFRGAAAKLGTSSGALVKWAYGDRSPDRVYAGRMAALFAIPLEAWDIEPTEKFVLPAARRAA